MLLMDNIDIIVKEKQIIKFIRISNKKKKKKIKKFFLFKKIKKN